MKRKMIQNHSVRKKLLISLLILSLTMTCVVAFISYSLAEKRVESISMRLAKQISEDWGSYLSEQFDALHDLSSQLMQSDELTTILQTGPNDSEADETEAQLERYIASLLNQGVGANVSFSYIYVYLSDGRSYESRSDYAPCYDNYEACIRYFELQGAPLTDDGYISPQWAQSSDAGNIPYLAYLRFIYEPITMEKKGIAVFGAEVSAINAMDFGSALSGQLLTSRGVVIPIASTSMDLTVEDGQVIVGTIQRNKKTDNSIPFTDSLGRSQIVSYYSLPSFGGYLIVPFEFYESVRNSEMSEYIKSMLLTGAIMVVFVVLLAFLVSHGLSKSVNELAGFIHKIKNGQTELRYVAKTEDEIALLGKQVNIMLDEIQHSNMRREEDLLENQALKLELMQQQINPHLLYNTLDSVVWVLRQGHPEEAAQLVYALSDFFRISLSKGNNRVEMKDEIQLIRRYLDIQRLARNKSFTLNCSMDDALLSYPIIKLSLQPLVENSVLHGFDGYCDEGVIDVSARCENGYVLIDITDNGIGMTDEEVVHINDVLRLPERPEEFCHFGLLNINRRIVRAYGVEYGLSVESAVSEYTTVRVKLPQHIPEKVRREERV